MSTVKSSPVQSRSKSCGEEIVWAKTQSGKVSPFNKKRQALWMIEPDLLGEPAAHSLGAGWVPHWATCPQADKWRKK